MHHHRHQSRTLTLALVAIAAIAIGSANTDAQVLSIANHSFEDFPTLTVGGIWPEVDLDPVGADFWLEPGPPDSVPPPGFQLPPYPEGTTIDQGVFFNSPEVDFDGPGGNPPAPNPGFLPNADGNQVAYLFAKDDLEPGVALIQKLTDQYEQGNTYTLTTAVAKSFFLPPQPFGGAQLALRLMYEDTNGDLQLVKETLVGDGEVLGNLLRDFDVVTDPVAANDPWLGRPIAIEYRPAVGTSGVWDLDNVRLTIPEPTSAALVLFGSAIIAGRKRHAARA